MTDERPIRVTLDFPKHYFRWRTQWITIGRTQVALSWERKTQAGWCIIRGGGATSYCAGPLEIRCYHRDRETVDRDTLAALIQRAQQGDL